MEKLILASGSPRRRELLSLIGVPFVVEKSDADETITEKEPGKIVMELSNRKAEDIARQITDSVILGADTIVWAQGRILGKPRDRKEAGEMLRLLSGKAHEVYTGVTILAGKAAGPERTAVNWRRDSFFCRTTVHVHAMTEEEIEAYLDTGDAFDKAGSYGIQGPFAAYVDGIEGDYQNVVGLPVSEVYRHLRAMGFTWSLCGDAAQAAEGSSSEDFRERKE